MIDRYSREEMKKIWAINLELMSVFKKVCQKHNLKFFMGFGTLLGAFRHQGFIPWDDDVDIIMPRSDFEKLKEREVFWIAGFDCTNPLVGYNMSIKSIGVGIGEENSFYGKKHTQDTKDKISKINKGRKHPEELVNRLREIRRKENLSEETLDKKRNSVLGDKNPFFGKKHSEETKEKIRNKRVGTKMSEEAICKIVTYMINRPKYPCKFCNRIIGGGKGNLNKHEQTCEKQKK